MKIIKKSKKKRISIEGTSGRAKERQKVIFVTVGNGEFDSLIKEIDHLKASGIIKEKVIAQVGHGRYLPKYCEWFTFKPSLEDYYAKAEIVITHGGPGVVFEALRKKKKLITIPNRDRTDRNHQVEYLRAMAKETTALLYCDHVRQLAEALQKARITHVGDYAPPSCTIHEVIGNFLERNRKREIVRRKEN